MKVFITGGAGFIGSHLAERLLAGGHEVLVLDDLSTGAMENIEPFIEKPAFDYRIGTVTDGPLVREMADRCDITVHLAAAVGVRLIVEQPVHTIETNVHGTEVVLDAVSRKKKPIVLASTSEVYGKSDKIPFSESDDLVMGATTHARWAYACSKALDEWLGLAYHRDKGVPVTVVRLFNTVGPRQTGQYGMVLPTFSAQAVAGDPITVYGTGDQSRCFCHVHDAVQAIEALMWHGSTAGHVFNVGSDQEVTINQLAELVRAEAGSDSEIQHISYEEAYTDGFEDMQRRVPDVSKLEEWVGFRPDTPLAKIVEDVVAEKRGAMQPVRGA